jgi:xylulokinase
VSRSAASGPCTPLADELGNPLRSAILYNDTRAGDEIDELIERYGEEEIIQRSLSRISHQSVGPKLMWLRRHQEEVWERAEQLLMANSFIVERLTGEYTLDSISASFCIPMFDPRERAWVDEWTDEVAPSLVLPRVLEPWEVAGTVTKRDAQELLCAGQRLRRGNAGPEWRPERLPVAQLQLRGGAHLAGRHRESPTG